VGQCSISHPTPPFTPVLGSVPAGTLISPIPDPTITPSGHNHPLDTGLTSSRIPTLNNNSQSHLRRDSRTFDTGDPAEHPGEGLRLGGLRDETIEEEWSGGNLGYRKGENEAPLEARIERIFYINLYGQVKHCVTFLGNDH
jgi:hypothetical protein